MGWRTLIITQHTKVSFQTGQVVIKSVDKTYQVPLSDLNILIIETTQATLTSYVIQKLIKNDVRVIFCDEYYIPVGEIGGYYSNNKRVRNIELQMNWSEELKGILWQRLVSVKMRNQQQILQQLQINDDGITPHIDQVLIGDSTNQEAVVARMYFMRLFERGFSRRDDSNPINAHLNYGYQVVLAATAREIQAAGFLTEIGIHHKSYQNALNFASDIMEPLRPLIDRITWQLIDEKQLDFSIDTKIRLVDVLNTTIRFNGSEAMVTSVITEILRSSLIFLNQDGCNLELLPEWEFEL